MGINSKCFLPNDIRANDIVTAIAYLCGAERVRQTSRGAFWAGVNPKEVSYHPNANEIGKRGSHVYILPSHEMQYFTIEIAPTKCDLIWHSGSLFLFPQEERKGYYCLYAGVSEFWGKIERALVDLFGGYIDDNDCDSSDVDYKKRKPRKYNAPADGDEWDEFQNAMLNLPKLFDFVEDK